MDGVSTRARFQGSATVVRTRGLLPSLLFSGEQGRF
jgi:hypothetical protein